MMGVVNHVFLLATLKNMPNLNKRKMKAAYRSVKYFWEDLTNNV